MIQQLHEEPIKPWQSKHICLLKENLWKIFTPTKIMVAEACSPQVRSRATAVMAEACAGTGSVEGAFQPVLALSVLIDTGLHSFGFSFSSPEVFSSLQFSSPPRPTYFGFEFVCLPWSRYALSDKPHNNNNNNRRLVTLAEHTSDHGRQTNSSTEDKPHIPILFFFFFLLLLFNVMKMPNQTIYIIESTMQ